MSNQTKQEQVGRQEGEGGITILVNKKPLHVQAEIVEPSRLRDFAGAPSDYEVWKIVKNPDPEGELPVDDIQVTGPIEVKSGDRFRIVPPGTFGGRR